MHPLPEPGEARLLVPSWGGRHLPTLPGLVPGTPNPPVLPQTPVLSGSAKTAPKGSKGVGKPCHWCWPLWGALMGKKKILSSCHGPILGTQVVPLLQGKELWSQPCWRAMPPVVAPCLELGSLIFLIHIILLPCPTETGLQGPCSAPGFPCAIRQEEK